MGGVTFANTYAGTALGTDAAAADTTYSQLQISVTPTGGSATTVDIGAFDVKAGQSITQAAAAAINNKLGETGVYAEVKAGVINLTSVKGGQEFALAFGGPVVAGATVSTAANLGLTETSTNGGDLATTNSFVQGLDITTFAGAQRALEVVDKALTAVNSSRADMGAIQNRFSSVVANLSSNSENLSAARSRIQDADFAKETAQLTRNQILQQAGTAMLAQANQSPSSVMSLLQG